MIARWLHGLVGALRRSEVSSHDPYVGPRHVWRVEMVRREMRDVVPAGPVLDAGCGDGDLAAALASSGQRVVALDRHFSRLCAARFAATAADRDGLGDVEWVCADVARLPFVEGAFAGIVCSEVLEHVSDDTRAVAETWRVLRPAGWLVATVPAGPERYSEIDRMVGHVRRYDRDGVLQLFRSSDFALCLLRGWGFPFGRLYDQFVQRPALHSKDSGAAPLVSCVARSRLASALWRALFWVDERMDAGGHGSGWLIKARRHAPCGILGDSNDNVAEEAIR